MGKKKLVVVESPGKISKISHFLGTDYIVRACFGHIMDLPQKGLGIDVKNNFEPEYGVIPKKKDTVLDLKKVAKEVDEVYLCSDNDREGSFISESIRQVLDRKGLTFHRAIFNSITKTEIVNAINNPTVIDANLVEAQQARRLLDRLMGFKISPLLWRTGRDADKKSRSAGRVQSVGLLMIVDKQKEIDAFKSVKYWTVEATLSDGKNEFVVQFVPQKDKFDIDTSEKAEKLVKYLEEQEFIVNKVDKSQERKNPPVPFTTSTIQQVGSGALNWNSKRTMGVAQKLYEGGHITYMRTDSVIMAKEAVDEVRVLIPTISSSKYLPSTPNVYQNKSKNAQEAHECIRNTHNNDLATVLSGVVDPEEKKLLELIWRRAIASQMVPAIYDKVELIVKAGKASLKASGQTQQFDGYLKIWTHTDAKELSLPDLKVGQKLTKVKIESTEHETKPPSRYTNASLVKELESNGVGRPSTYASIIDTLIARLYVEMDGKAFVPTQKGIEVSDFLKEHFSNLINVTFTAQMENELDEVAEGKKTRTELLIKFYKTLSETIEVAQSKMSTNEVSAEACPVCGSQLFVKLNRKDNQRFLACSSKECKKTFNMDKDEKPVDKQTEKLDVPCPECGGALLKKTSSKGTTFYGCENYKSKGCKITANDKGEIRIPPKDTGRKCKKCKKGTMLERKNKQTGEIFFGCSLFPKCRNVESGTK